MLGVRLPAWATSSPDALRLDGEAHGDISMSTKSKKKNATPESDVAQITNDTITLGFLAREYVQHLEAVDKSPSSVFGYKMDLDIALAEMGADTPLAILTEDWVRKYYDCERVTRTKTGAIKAKPTVDKTRRVLRLALTWAVEKGWIASAPIPGATSIAS
jgi:hypothetical protein